MKIGAALALLAFIPSIPCRGGTSVAAQPLPTFRFGNTQVSFYHYAEERWMLSANCYRGPDKEPQCLAYASLDNASFVRAKQSTPYYGGKNPGSPVCRSLGGEVAIGRDSRGNENGFCRYSDNSWISLGSLGFQAQMNDEARGTSAAPETGATSGASR